MLMSTWLALAARLSKTFNVSSPTIRLQCGIMDQDVSNYTPVSSRKRTSKYDARVCANIQIDRLPTVSASQSLQLLQSADEATPISTGLPHLDLLLQGLHDPAPSYAKKRGGLSRGTVTEVYGPPGSGKTTLA